MKKTYKSLTTVLGSKHSKINEEKKKWRNQQITKKYSQFEFETKEENKFEYSALSYS